LTLRAESPVRDVGLVDVIAVIVGRRETRRRAHRTVDVDDASALSTDEVMMIVIDAVFVASGRSDGLNATKKTVVDQHSESVVDRLTRNATNIGLGNVGDFVGCHVRSARDSSHHGQTLGSYLNPVLSELINGRNSHWHPQYPILDKV